MKKKIILIIALLLSVLLIICLIDVCKKSKLLNSINNEDGGFAYMYETKLDSHSYTAGTQDSWSDGTYILNKGKSECEKETELEWDNVNNAVIFSGMQSNSCKLYFDVKAYHEKCNDNTLSCIIAKKQGTNVGNNGEELIYHDGEGTGVNSNLEAEDSSYRYSGKNPNNYVCFGASSCSGLGDDHLYRIIGVFKNEKDQYEVKLIKADYASSSLLGTDGTYNSTISKVLGGNDQKDAIAHRYRGSLSQIGIYRWQSMGSDDTQHNWPTAILNVTNLNKNFLSKFSQDWQNKISEHFWQYHSSDTSWQTVVLTNSAKDAYKKEFSANGKKEHAAKVGLIYVSDYYYGASSSGWNKSGCNGACYTWTNNNAPDKEGVPTGSYSSGDPTKDYRANIDNNWLYLGLSEWTITEVNAESARAFILETPGTIGTMYTGINSNAVRPVFYLNSDVKFSKGTGSSSDPYYIS